MAYRPAAVAIDVALLEGTPDDLAARALERLGEARVERVVVSAQDALSLRERLEDRPFFHLVDRFESVVDRAAGLDDEDAWRHLARSLGVSTDQLAAVSVEEADARAARRAGITSAWVPHGRQTFIHEAGPADVRGEDLGAAIDQLLALPEAIVRPPAGP